MPKKIDEQLLKIERRIGRSVRTKMSVLLSLINEEVDKLGFTNIKEKNDIITRLRRKIPQLIKRAGLNKVTSDINRQLPQVSQASVEQLARDLGITATALRAGKTTPGKRMIIKESLKNNNRNVIDMGKRFRKVLLLKNISTMTRSQFDKLMISTTNLSQGQYAAQVTTAVQGFDNSVTSIKANAIGAEEFRYAGAEDSKNRDFCAERVNKVFTDAEAATWDNGQGLPADIYLGGYQCRHRKEYILR